MNCMVLLFKYVSCIVFVYFCTAAIGQDCGGHWKRFEDQCYLVSSSLEEWSTALLSCRQEDANLVIVSSPEIDVRKHIYSCLFFYILGLVWFKKWQQLLRFEIYFSWP